MIRGGGKRGRIALKDLTMQTSDPDFVKRCFDINSFNAEEFLNKLSKESLVSYKSSIEGCRIVDRHISFTVDAMEEYETMKELT